MPPEPRLHGRERNKIATRRALRAAALELGLDRGWAQVRIEEIAAAAGVSPRTFFNYFETKEDAALLEVLAVPDDALAAFAASTAPASRVWEELTALFAADVDRVDGGAADFSRRLRLQRASPELQSRQLGAFTRFEARLAGAIAARLPDDERGRLRARLLSGSCVTAVRVGLEQWAADPAGSPRGHVENAFRALPGAFPT